LKTKAVNRLLTVVKWFFLYFNRNFYHLFCWIEN
jgi:hypothetical protein